MGRAVVLCVLGVKRDSDRGILSFLFLAHAKSTESACLFPSIIHDIPLPLDD